MNRVQPDALIELVASEIPSELQESLYLTGSLAAAYHFEQTLVRRGVRTKDADLIVHPAANRKAATGIAERLFSEGWRPKDECHPQPTTEPVNALSVVRVYPPTHKDYFLELIGIPDPDDPVPHEWPEPPIPQEWMEEHLKKWVEFKVTQGPEECLGWYGLPSFRFMGVTAEHLLTSKSGLQYAHPAMMALANLLAHRSAGTHKMSSAYGGREILRSAKDLGRVLALTLLTRMDREQDVETWGDLWIQAMRTCFPEDWRDLSLRIDDGLRAIQADRDAFEQALHSVNYGLLEAQEITDEQLGAVADTLRGEFGPIGQLQNAARAAQAQEPAPALAQVPEAVHPRRTGDPAWTDAERTARAPRSQNQVTVSIRAPGRRDRRAEAVGVLADAIRAQLEADGAEGDDRQRPDTARAEAEVIFRRIDAPGQSAVEVGIFDRNRGTELAQRLNEDFECDSLVRE